jgi:CRISPR/Cas system CSM-associated protein Csm3 (group 7 of RAMP superfamily)
MNVYNFVRFGKPGIRRAVLGHDKFQEHSGRFTCELQTLTELFIPETQGRVEKREHQKLKLLRGDEGQPFLPGSSLKGVIRSVAEALSGSCLTLPTRLFKGSLSYRSFGKEELYKIPYRFEHCSEARNACPACRLFGLLSKDEVHLGKVMFSDATAVEKVTSQQMIIEALMEPKPRHRAFYGLQNKLDTARGRKFYYHRPGGARTTAQQTQYNKTIEAIVPPARFKFEVEYVNLDEKELALLIFALVLEDQMRHKVGMGKPVGLGSAQITIANDSWVKIDRTVRYTQLGGGTTTLSGEALAAEINQWRVKFHQHYSEWEDCLSDLKQIWTWDENSRNDPKYPGQAWFRQNPKTPLEQAP